MSEAGKPGAQELDSAAVADLFPYVRQVTYLNSAAAGLSWEGQGAAAARFYDEHKSQGYSARMQWRAELGRAQQLLAQLLGVAAEDVSFTSSTSEALNLVAHGMQLGSADEVLLCEDEFPSVIQAWSPAALRGATLVRVPITDEKFRTDALIANVTDRTRAICVSHVHWCTGTRVDLERIAGAAQKVGARLIVDGAHAVGAIDVNAAVADFYTGSVFKWLLSAFGIAYVVTKSNFAAELQPIFRGYANEPPSQKLQYAHANYPAIYALSATLELLGKLGWRGIQNRVASLTASLHRELVKAGWEVVTPIEARSGIISVRDRNAVQTVERLAQETVQIEERAGLLRASPHFYNTEADLRRYLEVLGRSPG